MAGTTLKDVAAAAGVSISTASRSLSGNPAISESTRQRVKDTAIKLNYRPNAQARALRSSRSNAIGLVIPSLDNAYFAAMAAAIEEAADKQGLATMITSCGEDPQRLVKSLDALMERQVDGIIAVPLEGAEEALEQARAYRPLVLIDRTLGQIPAVLSDPHGHKTSRGTAQREGAHAHRLPFRAAGNLHRPPAPPSLQDRHPRHAYPYPPRQLPPPRGL